MNLYVIVFGYAYIVLIINMCGQAYSEMMSELYWDFMVEISMD